MNAEIEKKTSLLLDEIKQAKRLSVDEKLDMETLLTKAAATTNGTEDKIQGVTEVLFGLISMMISRRIDGNEGKFQGLFKLIEACKWQIVIISGILSGLLIFRPEVGELIKMALK